MIGHLGSNKLVVLDSGVGFALSLVIFSYILGFYDAKAVISVGLSLL